MKPWLKRIGLFFLIIAAIIFWGRWFLDLFGVIKYELPLSQKAENIVQIDLLDTSKPEYIVLGSFTDDQFINEFLQIDAGRYANDPPRGQGNRAIRVCYVDGGYDLLGDIVECYSTTGESLSLRGWYHISYDDMDVLWGKYLNLNEPL